MLINCRLNPLPPSFPSSCPLGPLSFLPPSRSFHDVYTYSPSHPRREKEERDLL